MKVYEEFIYYAVLNILSSVLLKFYIDYYLPWSYKNPKFLYKLEK